MSKLIDVRFRGELVGRIEPSVTLSSSVLLDELISDTDIYEELRDRFSMIPIEPKLKPANVIRDRIENLKNLINDKEMVDDEVFILHERINALNWVLGND